MLQSYKPGGGGGVGGSSGSIQMKLGGVKLNSRHHQTFAAGHDVDDDSSTAGAFKKVGPQELSSASAIESRSDHGLLINALCVHLLKVDRFPTRQTTDA